MSGKTILSAREHTHNTYSRTHARTHTHTHTNTHARTHARTHTHTHNRTHEHTTHIHAHNPHPPSPPHTHIYTEAPAHTSILYTLYTIYNQLKQTVTKDLWQGKTAVWCEAILCSVIINSVHLTYYVFGSLLDSSSAWQLGFLGFLVAVFRHVRCGHERPVAHVQQPAAQQLRSLVCWFSA